MPTANPRINVTLSPSLYELVGGLARHQRVSRSMVLRELLEAAEPGLVQVVAMLQAAKDMSEAAKQRLRADLDGTIQSIEFKTEQAIQLAAGVTSDLVSQAEAIRGRRPRRAAKASGALTRAGGPSSAAAKVAPRGKRPPSSNRGVKS